MKIRYGFVSNSSSSSFVCNICGRQESGYDASSSDFEMSICENDHVFCEKHSSKSLSDLSFDEKKILLNDCCYDQEEINNANEDNIDDLLEENDYACDCLPAQLCPCCNLEYPTNKQLLEYMLLKAGKTKEQTLKELRADYKDYESLKKDLK